jgi:hypothetical protein
LDNNIFKSKPVDVLTGFMLAVCTAHPYKQTITDAVLLFASLGPEKSRNIGNICRLGDTAQEKVESS